MLLRGTVHQTRVHSLLETGANIGLDSEWCKFPQFSTSQVVAGTVQCEVCPLSTEAVDKAFERAENGGVERWKACGKWLKDM
jgi:hypothetical protein